MFRISLLVVVVISALWFHPLPATAAFAGNGNSTATIAALTLQPPSSLSVTPFEWDGDCYVALSWSLPEAGAPTSWIIQRYQGSSPSGSARTVSGSLTWAIDDTISKRVAYTWRIRGVAGTQWTSTTTTSPSETVSNSCT